jgi:hypothetical protein
LQDSEEQDYTDYNCQDGCIADYKAISGSYLLDRNEDYEFPIAYDNNLLSVGTLSIPSGAVLRPLSTYAELTVRSVADSRVQNAENKILESRQKEQGNFKTFAQTVLSPMFECVPGDGVIQPFPLSLTYTAQLDTFPVVDDDGFFSSGYNYDDVCFAYLREIVVDTGRSGDSRYFKYSGWRCLLTEDERSSQPVRASDSTAPEGIVSFTINTCNASYASNAIDRDGIVYAFIFSPIEATVNTNSDLFTWLEENESWVFLIIIISIFIMFAIFYACVRLYRYRKRYKEKRDAVKLQMRDVKILAMNGGGVMGDEEWVLMKNPMQKGYDDDMTEEDMNKREQYFSYLKKIKAKNDEHLEMMRNTLDTRRTELDRVKAQYHTAQGLKQKNQGPRVVQQKRNQYDLGTKNNSSSDESDDAGQHAFDSDSD